MKSLWETTVCVEACSEESASAQRANGATLLVGRDGVPAARPADDFDEALSEVGSGAWCGKYRILKQLGTGGQGRVFLAIDEALGRKVALKTLAAMPLESEDSIRRLRNEARAVAKLHHRNIIEPYEVIQRKGIPFLAMEYVEGQLLAEAVHEGSLTRRHAVEVVATCCEAMEHAHQRGVIHRDLKPQNILIASDGTPKVMDFGLAKCLLEDGRLSMHTMEGKVMGSPAYMAPEQARGERELIGPRTDVYALGATLYQCLTGCLPHVADTPMGTMHRVIHEDPRQAMALDPTIGRDLNAICMKAMEKDPDDRYASAGDMAADLRRYLNCESVHARPATITDRLIKAVRRHLDIALVASVFLTLLSATVSIGIGGFQFHAALSAQEAVKADLKSVVNTAAMMFSAEEIGRISRTKGARSEEFRDLVQRLNEVRRRNPQVRNASILKWRANPPGFLLVADADALLPKAMRATDLAPGEPFAPARGSVARDALDGVAVNPQPTRTKWGEILSGYAPVCGEGGAEAGLLKLDVGVAHLQAESRPLLRTAGQVSGLAAVLFMGLTAATGIRVARRRQPRF